MKNLVIFDLDDTLLGADSEFHFTKFIVEKGMLDKNFYFKKIKAFDADYRSGNLNFKDYMKFLLFPLIGRTKQEVNELVSSFIVFSKDTLIDDLSYKLIEQHKKDKILIASGALDFIVEGFASYFNISEFLGTKTELIENKITGETVGEPNFEKGKLLNVMEWCEERDYKVEDAIFYTDSINDLPLVKACRNSIIISQDAKLEKYAKENSLEIIYR